MPLSNVDIWGVERGMCYEPNCDCKGYLVETQETQKQLRCDYCDHKPASHGKLNSIGQDSAPPVLKKELAQDLWVPKSTPSAGTWPAHDDDSTGTRAGPPPCDIPMASASCSGSSHERNVPPSQPLQGLPASIPHSDVPLQDDPQPCAPDPCSQSEGVSQARGHKGTAGCQWSPDNLPNFSSCVEALLQGTPMDDKKHCKLSRQLREELTMFLDDNSLIQSGSTAHRRWQYKNLGDALAKKYPYMQWENQTGGAQTYAKRSEVYALSTRNFSASLDLARISVLLRVTIEERRLSHMDPLPYCFLHETVLTVEAQLRFCKKMEVLKGTIHRAIAIFGDMQGKQATFWDLERYLHPNGEHHLLNEGEVPEDVCLPVPHIYRNQKRGCIYGGSADEIVDLSPECSTEKALALCLTLYYIKNLHYPIAIAQPLVLLQKVLLPNDAVPRGLMNATLQKFLVKLRTANVI